MSDDNESKPAPASRLSREVMAAIGRELRIIHGDIVAEGVPERFAEILRTLDDTSDEHPKDKPPG